MNTPHNKDKDSVEAPPKPKKPYTEPVLIDMGSFEDLTQAIGRNGSADGGSKKDMKNTRS